ncbi:insulin-like growth factor-binding protein 1 [Onychomys torridus]|uniref:insulin-like growth factor-binding protein 1 n=1 Tax=Onychomys torridus TaxID=38674 RepID=UPI00167F5D32|nr:insulin-like growth factor-binding protein 1 [Onychomys torridus]
MIPSPLHPRFAQSSQAKQTYFEHGDPSTIPRQSLTCASQPALHKALATTSQHRPLPATTQPASSEHLTRPSAQRAVTTVVTTTCPESCEHGATAACLQGLIHCWLRWVAMPEFLAVVPWRFLILLAFHAGVATGTPQPWRCAPCTAERLGLCPPVPASCPEISRPAGCGCCPTCALPLGAACGVATARCAQGLSCRALPGEPRPLHALTRGQGACVPEPAAPATRTLSSSDREEAKATVAPEGELPGSPEMTEEQLLERFHLMAPSSEDRPILWNAISTYNSIRAREIADLKKWKEPCQRELYKVLERLAAAQQKAGDEIYKFYLPNCNKNGFYHSKQCETSLDGEAGLCWCVYPWNGKKIPGSLETRGDPNCHQYFNVQK